jgi:hypothetical protein
VSRLHERFFVGLPDAVNDWWLSRVGRGSMIEFPAQVNYSHFVFPFPPVASRRPASFRSPGIPRIDSGDPELSAHFSIPFSRDFWRFRDG